MTTARDDLPDADQPAPAVGIRLDRPVRRQIVCMHCGEPQEKHCEFEAAMPDGCVCPPVEWGDYVLDVCAAFVGDGPICERCEHDRECHAV